MVADYLFRPYGIHHNLSESGSDALRARVIVPRHPFSGPRGQFQGVALQLDQRVEGIWRSDHKNRVEACFDGYANGSFQQSLAPESNQLLRPS
jgi:hypothetical protein